MPPLHIFSAIITELQTRVKVAETVAEQECRCLEGALPLDIRCSFAHLHVISPQTFSLPSWPCAFANARNVYVSPQAVHSLATTLIMHMPKWSLMARCIFAVHA